MTEQLNGKNFIARRRLSLADGTTIAAVGETCERVPAGKHGGTVSDALARLLQSGKIAPAPRAAAAPTEEPSSTTAKKSKGAKPRPTSVDEVAHE